MGVIGAGTVLAIGGASAFESSPATTETVPSVVASETQTIETRANIEPAETAQMIKPATKSTPKPVTKAEPVSDCHPSYSDCLKINAGDYDCAKGKGDGPNYTGPVEVHGSDPFDLDRDNDGWGCE